MPFKKKMLTLKEKAAAAAAGDVFKDVKEANGVRYIASQVEVSDAGALRTFADQWKQARLLRRSCPCGSHRRKS